MMGHLAGLRVLDFTVWRPGPYATQLLAELGADIIKVEPPGGDPMRVYPELFASLNANKRSVLFDLKNDADRGRALDLSAAADVVIEGFRPGVAARLGVGYDAVSARQPSVVYCSISGMGQTGPLALVPGHDLNYQAWAGSLAPDGGDPRIPGVPIADLAGGMAAAFAVCAAVVRQSRTGTGEYIDVAMADVLATWTGAVRPLAEGADPAQRGVPGYGTFATADSQYIALGVLSEPHFWAALCDVLGLPFETLPFAERLTRVDELQARVAGAIAGRRRDELVAQLLAADVPAAPVLDRAGMLDVPHFKERTVVTADPWATPATGYPVQFSNAPASRTTPPPALDEHRGASFLPR
jgi:crotonobetainyl-CoA:carnitine CoA-transferase CaiB-like acyl-CoA transferase